MPPVNLSLLLMMKTRAKWRVISFVLALIAAVILIAVLVPESAKPEPATPLTAVSVSPPLQRQVTGIDIYTGRFDAIDTVNVRPRVSGYIDRVAFKDGVLVTKGQLLYVIDPRPYKDAVIQAQGRLADASAKLSLANSDHGRAKTLITSGTIPQSRFDQSQQSQQSAQAALTVAKGALAKAQLDLEFTEVRAPMNGRIGRHVVSAGNVVEDGSASATLLATIVSTDPIDLYFDIDEESYLRYGRQVLAGKRSSAGGVGGKVEVALPGDTAPSKSGTLDFSDNRLDRSTGTLRARARVSNSDGLLTPGQFARAYIEGEALHAALLVPDAAIVIDATNKVLYVVGSDDKVAQHNVEPGRLFGDLREIRSGLNADERVIVDGAQHVQVGEKVAPKLIPLKADQFAQLGDVP